MTSERFSGLRSSLRKALHDRGRWTTVMAYVLWGLLAGRLVVEVWGAPLRFRWVIATIISSGTLGFIAGRLLSRPRHAHWIILVPCLYLLWPWPEPQLAALGIVFCLALLAARRFSTERSWPELIVAGVFVALYMVTLAPGLLPADAGEFQLVAATLGIAHPPGYALYTMLGKLVTVLPLGAPTRSLNALSAAAAAATVLVLMRSIRLQGGSLIETLAPALMLGISATFWAQATTANIRTLTALFTALCLATLLRWDQTGEDRWLTWFALCFGLGVGHHASLGLLGPPFLAFILLSDWRLITEPRRWPIPVMTLIGTFVVWLYFPIRSAMGPAFDPSPIRDWAGFWQHVLALGFGGDMFRYRTWDVLRPRIGVWSEIMRLEFGMLLPILSALGFAFLARRRWRTALLLVGTWFMNTLAAVTYRAPQTVEYLMPSYVAMAFALGLGLVEVGRLLSTSRIASSAPALALCLVALMPMAENWRSFWGLHQDDTTRQAALAMLDAAPQDSLVLSSWHHATPMWYLQLVEGQRPDITVTYVYPEGGTPNAQVWLRRIEEGLDYGPVVVTNRYHAYRGTDLVWTPLADGWQAHRQALSAVPENITPNEIAFGDQITLIGHTLAANTLTPGQGVDVRVCWTPQTELTRAYTSFCQLIGPQGVVGQADLHHDTYALAPGEIRVDQFQFPVLTHATPGTYQLITGFYYVEDGAARRLASASGDHVTLSSVTLSPAQSGPVSLHPQRERWSGGLELIGVDFDQSVAGQTRLYLHWHQAHESGAPSQVQLLTDGVLVAQTAMPELPARAYQTLALDVPDGLDKVDLLVLENGTPQARLGAWNRDRRAALTLHIPAGGVRYVPLGGEMALVQSGMPDGIAAGEDAWFYPQLLAQRPLTHDYSFSLGVVGQGGWEVKSDGTPAMGAIPTLKWVRGWRVTDPRHLVIPPDTARQAATVTLSCYDAFTLEPVPVQDERLVRQGQGVTLELGQVTIAP